MVRKSLTEMVLALPLKEGCVSEPPKPVNAAVAALVAGWDFRLRPELTQERLKEVLHYNPETGVFTSKVARGSGAKVGKPVGCYERGYLRIAIDRRHYWAQQLAFLYVYGRFPTEVDHIDRNPANNRIANLVESNRTIQAYNSKVRRDNTSGHKGVTWDSWSGKWRASIGSRHFGRFDTLEEAVAARQAAEIKLLGCTTEELQDPRNRRPKRWRRM